MLAKFADQIWCVCVRANARMCTAAVVLARVSVDSVAALVDIAQRSTPAIFGTVAFERVRELPNCDTTAPVLARARSTDIGCARLSCEANLADAGSRCDRAFVLRAVA